MHRGGGLLPKITTAIEMKTERDRRSRRKEEKKRTRYTTIITNRETTIWPFAPRNEQ